MVQINNHLYTPFIRLEQERACTEFLSEVNAAPESKLTELTLLKLKRAFIAAAKIGKGLASLEKQGIAGRILHEYYWMEALTDSHFFGADIRKYFYLWEQSNSPNSFRKWFREFRQKIKLINPLSEVTYLSPEKKENFQLSIVNGQLIASDGSLFITKQYSSHFGRENSAMFVISSGGALYAGTQILSKMHHTSFVNGEAILGAGVIKTDDNGTIIEITDESGHYRPDAKTNLETLRYFKKQGVNLEKVQFFIAPKSETDEPIYHNAANYLEFLEKSL